MAKIFSVGARAGIARVVDPVGRALVRAGISPNAVTVGGTVGVVIGATVFGTTGHFVIGALFVTFCALTDLFDGAMARAKGGPTRFGALLDSTMDRVADGAIFGAVVWYYGYHDDGATAAAALICLVAGQVVSYVKARAEGLGMTANVGIAERVERLVLVGVGGLLTGLGLSWGLPAALWLLAVLSVVTVGQRVMHVYQKDRAFQKEQAAGDTRDGATR
jgi:CDP-diacylglycerol--glycerol-3-phosphate 3-phosphatidyltransferase